MDNCERVPDVMPGLDERAWRAIQENTHFGAICRHRHSPALHRRSSWSPDVVDARPCQQPTNDCRPHQAYPTAWKTGEYELEDPGKLIQTSCMRTPCPALSYSAVKAVGIEACSRARAAHLCVLHCGHDRVRQAAPAAGKVLEYHSRPKAADETPFPPHYRPVRSKSAAVPETYLASQHLSRCRTS